MEIIQIAGLLIGGGVLLYFGADFMVKGGSHLARLLGISRLVIGLTVIAFGTSLPELIVSLVAALRGSQSLAIGNVVGSNIANVGLIIGLSASIFTIIFSGRKFTRDLNFLLGVSVLFAIMLLDGIVQRWEGLALFSGIVIYTTYCIMSGRQKYPIDDKTGTVLGNVVLLVLGIAGLSFGANIFVNGATQLANRLGGADSEMVIGLTVAAYGTSLPELATSLVAAYRKESEISLGNIVGSNLFNILGVVGIVSTITPLAVDPGIVRFELPVMIFFVLALYPILRINRKIPKAYSLLLLLGYVSFIVALFVRIPGSQ